MDLLFVRLVGGCGLLASFKPKVDFPSLKLPRQHLHQKKKKKPWRDGGVRAAPSRAKSPPNLSPPLRCGMNTPPCHTFQKPLRTKQRGSCSNLFFLRLTVAQPELSRPKLPLAVDSRVASEARGRKCLYFLHWPRLLMVRSLKSSCPN